jgi:LuxR family maltose regulon positive regulatory protein
MLREVVRGETSAALELGERALAVLPEERSEDLGYFYVLMGLAHYYAGDLDAAEQALRQSRSHSMHLQTPWVHFIEMNASGAVLLARGKLRDATALFSQVIATGDSWNHQPVQHACWLLAEIEIERNRLDQAEAHLRSAIEFATRMGSILHRMQAHQLLADVAWARGRSGEAFEEIEAAISYAEKVGAASYARTAMARRARFWLSNGQTILARRWADDCDLDPREPFDHRRIYEYLTMARILIHEGETGVALRLLEPLEHRAAQEGRVLDLIEILVLRAIAHQRDGQPDAAIGTLTRAIDLGAPEGFCRVFLTEGAELRRLLRRVLHNSPHRSYVGTLLAALDGISPAQQPEPVSLDGLLSARELEVLRLVAVGESNSEIADHLFISEPTVKKHISNILGKLQVANRTRAVDQARQLGLI